MSEFITEALKQDPNYLKEVDGVIALYKNDKYLVTQDEAIEFAVDAITIKHLKNSMDIIVDGFEGEIEMRDRKIETISSDLEYSNQQNKVYSEELKKNSIPIPKVDRTNNVKTIANMPANNLKNGYKRAAKFLAQGIKGASVVVYDKAGNGVTSYYKSK